MTLVRYWGSWFKEPRYSRFMARILARSVAAGFRTYLVCCREPE